MGGVGVRNVYIQTPGARGPGQEALSKGGVHLPTGQEGALRQSLRVAYPRGEGTVATPASLRPT